MSDDILLEATRALREESDGNADVAELTRARVMRSLHAKRRKRLTKTVVLVPIAAIVLGSTAAAAATGNLPRAVRAFTDAVGITEPVERPHGDDRDPSEPRVARAPVAPKPVAAPAAPADDEAAEPTAMEGDAMEADTALDSTPEPQPAEPPARATAKPRTATAAAPRAIAPTAPAPPAAVTPPAAAAETEAEASTATEAPADPADALYRKAHGLHFGAKNYAAALPAWEAYLREAPRGRFAAEASYNRAICLVRLGRTAAAKAALKPFAEGRWGGYRKADAAALLSAMGE